MAIQTMSSDAVHGSTALPYTLLRRRSETVAVNTFGARFRAARTTKGLTQDEISDLLGITKSAVSAWENDKESPAFDKLGAIRRTLDVPLDYLISGDSVATTGVAEAPPAYSDDAASLATEERTLLRRYRELDKSKRRALLALLR